VSCAHDFVAHHLLLYSSTLLGDNNTQSEESLKENYISIQSQITETRNSNQTCDDMNYSLVLILLSALLFGRTYGFPVCKYRLSLSQNSIRSEDSDLCVRKKTIVKASSSNEADTVDVSPVSDVSELIVDELLTEITKDVAVTLPKSLNPVDFLPDGTDYIVCGACKTAYLADEKKIGRKGIRVRCSICSKEWFQNNERLLKSDSEHKLTNMTNEKISEVRQIIADRNWPKYPRVDKFGIFMGNLPYTYDEKDIGDLVAEYGVTGISLVKDPSGQSKGFAFIEVWILIFCLQF